MATVDGVEYMKNNLSSDIVQVLSRVESLVNHVSAKYHMKGIIKDLLFYHISSRVIEDLFLDRIEKFVTEGVISIEESDE